MGGWTQADQLRSRITRSCDILETGLRWLAGAAFLAFSVTVIIQVLGRNLFRVLAVIWTVELATLLFVWSIFLGAAIAVRHERHYVLQVVPDSWPRLRDLSRWFGLASIAAGGLIFLVYGTMFLGVAARRLATQLEIPQTWFYLAVPVGGAAMLIFVIEHVLDALLTRRSDAAETAVTR